MSEAITQTLIAALMVEALLRLWAATDPGFRIRMRLLVLLVPLVLYPALVVLAPFRQEPHFAERWAVFSVQRWSSVEALGVGLERIWLGLCVAAGVGLLLLDLVPYVRRRGRRRTLAQASRPAPPELMDQVRATAARLRVPVPPTALVDVPAVVLFCTGVRRPRLLVSRGALEAFDPEELDAAIAHELAHIVRADVLASWGLFTARILQAFNPPVHLVVHALARDLERRADDDAAGEEKPRLALGSALLKTWRSGQRGSAVFALPLLAVFDRAQEEELEQRCRRLLSPPSPPDPSSGLRLFTTAVALASLLFFVT